MPNACVSPLMLRPHQSAAAGAGPSPSLLKASTVGCFSTRRRPCRPWVYAQVLPFKARREMDLPFQSGSSPPELYVKELERIVKVTFPDSARIRYLGDSNWRATLKPVSFFNLSATPACDIRVSYENSALQLRSNKLVLDFKGIPVQFDRLDFDFSLLGQLYVGERVPSKGLQNKRFQGWVDLGLKVDMPLPFSLMPDAILMPVGNGILNRILGAMQSALLAGLLDDYKEWCRTQSNPLPPSISTEVASYKKLSSS